MAQDDTRRVGEERQQWEKGVEKGDPSRFQTLSGVPLDILYTPADVAQLDYLRDLGFPGAYPFTRGVRNNMYRGRHWTMREFSGFGTARDTNKRYKFLLEHGETGLSVAFDFPTLYG